MGPGTNPQSYIASLANHVEHVRRRVSCLLRNRRDAVDDCVQQTMVEAIRAAERHGPPHNQKAWISRIAERVVYRNRSKAMRREAMEILADPYAFEGAHSVLDTVVRNEDAARIHRAIDNLPSHDRDTIYHHYWQDQPCKDIGADNDTSATCVKSRLHRSRIQLRRHLAAHDEGRGR